MVQTFGTGARGFLVKVYQDALERAAGRRMPKGADGRYGNDTATMTTEVARAAGAGGYPLYKRMQEERALFGQAGPTMWQYVGAQWPELYARCLQLTAGFEGTGFSGSCGPANTGDTAGVTFGLVGFTSYNGELQGLLRQARAARSGQFDYVGAQALGAGGFRTMLSHIAETAERRAFERWALRDGRVTVSVQTWLAALGELDWFRRMQMEEAHKRYWSIARRQAQTLYAQPSDRAYALMFDIAVQNGGLKSGELNDLVGLISSGGYPTELDRMHLVHTALIARLRSANRPTRIIDDVRSRKGTIIVGSGRVHGANWSLRSFAL